MCVLCFVIVFPEVASVGQQNRNGNHVVGREKSNFAQVGTAFRIQ